MFQNSEYFNGPPSQNLIQEDDAEDNLQRNCENCGFYKKLRNITKDLGLTQKKEVSGLCNIIKVHCYQIVDFSNLVVLRAMILVCARLGAGTVSFRPWTSVSCWTVLIIRSFWSKANAKAVFIYQLCQDGLRVNEHSCGIKVVICVSNGPTGAADEQHRDPEPRPQRIATRVEL